MIRINLLPHREARRKRNKVAFVRLLVLAGVFGGAFVLAVGAFIATKISEQEARNNYIKAENAKLDEQIKEIANIKQEIEALKARQQAVEDLQSDRNQPVYLLDELVKQVPEGVYLRSFKQEGQKVSLNGVAQSNERVSELLHNVGNNSPWLEKPELIEIKAGMVGQGRDTKKIFEFTMNVGIKRPRDQEKAALAGAPAAGDKSASPAAGPAPAADKTAAAPAAAQAKKP
ncbi:MAG: PilN domain-containing protein [Burkholderiaceae bacterium]|nr:PilN domain-containing protein [Burkholderiaceae bacterium]